MLGLTITATYLALLFAFETSRNNLQPESVGSADTIWHSSDAGTYIRSARNFLNTGIFADKNGLPDIHRTIGYPSFLAAMMKVAGKHWVAWVLIAQCLLSACIYPALLFIAREWFGVSNRQAYWLFILYSLIGAGFVYAPIPLTDQIFTVALWVALAFGTLALKRGGVGSWVLHLLFLGFAASVRPTLALFPFAFIALGIAIKAAKRRSLVQWCCVLFLQFVLCQSPAIRNYVHHKIWLPSDVAVNNLSDYLARDVLVRVGRAKEYSAASSAWEKLPIQERIAEQMQFARDTYRAHPIIAARTAALNMGINTLETHWIQTMHYFRSSLHSDLRRWSALSPGLKMFHGVWAAVHAVILLFAVLGTRRAVLEKGWAWLVLSRYFLSRTSVALQTRRGLVSAFI